MYSKKLTIDNEQWKMKKEKILHSQFSIVNSENGQTLIELIVVVSVSVIVVGALVFATIASLRNAQFSKNQAQATKLAQEGLEIVRSSRDQNSEIVGACGFGYTYFNWNGDTSDPICSGVSCYSIWNCQIFNTCTQHLYFQLEPGALLVNSCGSSVPVNNYTDVYGDGKFYRAIIISDDSNYRSQKIVTAVVQWTDFSGTHQSKLTTVLGNLTQ